MENPRHTADTGTTHGLPALCRLPKHVAVAWAPYQEPILRSAVLLPTTSTHQMQHHHSTRKAVPHHPTIATHCAEDQEFEDNHIPF